LKEGQKMKFPKVKAQILAVFAASMMVSFASAQDETMNEEDERVLEGVTVIGNQNDDAMAAFRRGDYATAEVEFLDNASCALRRERNLIASAETARLNAARAETFANATGTNSGASSRGAGAGTPVSSNTGLAAGDSVAARNLQKREDRTCEQRAFQIYMAGLSQIQLGKTDDALRNFERATVISKTLYDAHYRIGLIKLLQGDVKTAEKQLSKMEGILKRCRKCDVREEIVASIDTLKGAINGDIKLQ